VYLFFGIADGRGAKGPGQVESWNESVNKVCEICDGSISSKVVFPIRSSAALSSLRLVGKVIMGVSPMTTAQPAMTGSYDYFLVALSVVIAILASSTALDLAGRVTAARGWFRQIWLAGGAAAMGLFTPSILELF
jgi:hypothetical protein